MDQETIRQLVRTVSQDLRLVPPFSTLQFAQAIEREWEIPIHLEPFWHHNRPPRSSSTGWCGFVDGIFVAYYYAGGSAAQQERIIYHELAHLLLGHVTPENPGLQHRDEPAKSTPEPEQMAEAFARVMTVYALYGDPAGDAAQPANDQEADPFIRFLKSMEGAL